MGIKSLGNTLSSFNYIFGRTGTEASGAAGSGAGIVSASGGNQATATGFTNSGYKYHVFTSSGALTVTNGSGEIQFLVVAGGGGGGWGNGGGAGAGGLRTNDPAVPAPMKVTSTVTLNPGPYTITVGSGGPSSPSPYPDRIGSDSSIGSLVVASGGGAGGPAPVGPPDLQPYMDGGSGGGSEPHAGSTIVSTDPLSPNKQGHDGNIYPGGSGGGGAGGGSPGPAGGAKCACPAFSSPIIHPGCPMPAAWQTYVGATGTYAGGGYGYPNRDNSFNAPNISPNSGLDDYAGIVNTGGGADSVSDSTRYGGKGIVIIRYQV